MMLDRITSINPLYLNSSTDSSSFLSYTHFCVCKIKIHTKTRGSPL